MKLQACDIERCVKVNTRFKERIHSWTESDLRLGHTEEYWGFGGKSVQEVNLLKPTVHVMHQQFNIQKLYVQPTLYLCVLYLSEDKQRLVPLNSIN